MTRQQFAALERCQEKVARALRRAGFKVEYRFGPVDARDEEGYEIHVETTGWEVRRHGALVAHGYIGRPNVGRIITAILQEVE